ncbi:MAG: protein translocase subunit SecF [Bdellovibrionota bacterium]|nr:protein translocase subunit SecF [Bdellovibrionota bacterium]
MMQVINPNTKIKFSNHYTVTAILSMILVGVSLFGLFTKMNYGVDFRGGAEIQVKFEKNLNLNNLRQTLKDEGFKVQVQQIGEPSNLEFLLKVAANEENLNEVTDKVSKALSADFSEQGVEIRKVDIVGPKAGAELRLSGFQAMFWALIAIMIYVGLRFDFKYSPGAIVALFHDVSIILGVFAFTGTEFTLQTVAALLAVIGYSVNDTVIVYDRVREHEQKFSHLALKDQIDNAINETLSRTILTSGTTLFISLTMFMFGGLAIRDFFLAISLGVLIGTYSSVYVAAPVTLLFQKILGSDEKSQAPANA